MIVNQNAILWNLAMIWNEVAFKPNRELKARDYIYASEVGSPFSDRWLKMRAVAYTNPPNSRSQRKFLAGNLIEHVTKQILIAAGIYRHDEVKVDATPYSDSLEVHGRLDFKAGGYVDGDKALERLSGLNLPDYLYDVGVKIIEQLAGLTLQEKILELKAVSTFAMDRVEKTRRAIPQHSLQGFHYQKFGGLPADVCYICKDDCRMAQFGINEEETEKLYRDDVMEMTDLHKKKKRPAPAPLMKFETTTGKFSKNLHVEYSPYLTMIYGFATPDDYRRSMMHVEKWNRTLSRYVLAETGQTTPTGKAITITPKNKECAAEIVSAGYKLNDLIACKIEIGAVAEEEEE